MKEEEVRKTLSDIAAERGTDTVLPMIIRVASGADDTFPYSVSFPVDESGKEFVDFRCQLRQVTPTVDVRMEEAGIKIPAETAADQEEQALWAAQKSGVIASFEAFELPGVNGEMVAIKDNKKGRETLAVLLRPLVNHLWFVARERHIKLWAPSEKGDDSDPKTSGS
jgi:hypothetical protein